MKVSRSLIPDFAHPRESQRLHRFRPCLRLRGLVWVIICAVMSSLWPFQRSGAGNEKLTAEVERALTEIEMWEGNAGAVSGSDVSVHVVAGNGNWHAAAWMLASWSHFTESGWPIVVHDDGTLPAEAADVLRRLFATLRMITRPEADAALQPVLRAFPFCESLRENHAGALRVLDVPHFAVAERFIVLDTEVLFLRHPREMIDWVAGGGGTCRLLADRESECSVTREEAHDELGVEPWPQATPGMALLTRSALDLDFLDTVLARTSLLRREAAEVAATLTILGASRGSGGLLSAEYGPAPLRRTEDAAVARHYGRAGWTRFAEDARALVRPHLFASSEPPDRAKSSRHSRSS